MKRVADFTVPALLVGGAVWPGAPPAALGAVVLAALLAALGTAGWRLAGLLLPGAAAATRLTAAVVVATAAATVPATLLGHFGLLRPWAFLLWAALLALGASRLGGAPPARAFPGPSAAGDPRRPTFRALERALGLGALVVLGWAAFVQLEATRYQPPGAFGFDDLGYHLTAVATWAERGDLAMPKFAVGDDVTPYYPIAAELASWVLLAPFETNDVAARWTQLPFALATLAAMASLAGRLGLRPRSILPALALYWSLERVFPWLALGAGNDHSTAFFLLAGTDGALELARRRTAGAGLYAGAGLGLLVGTKYVGLLFAPAVVALYGIARLAERRAGGGGGGLLPELAAAGAAAAAGGYTYLRNLATAGNPVFAVPVRVAGVDLFPGWEHATLAFRRQAPEFAIDLPGFLFRGDLWGPVAPWILVPAALAAPVVALVRSRRAGSGEAVGPGRRPVEAALLSLPVVSFLVFLHLIYDHRDVRYFLGGIALAAVAWGYLTDRLERSGRWGAADAAALARAATYGGVVAALALGTRPPGASPVPWLVAGLLLGALGAARWSAVRTLLRAAARRPGRVAAGAALLTLPVIAHVAARYPERRLEHRPIPRYLEDHLAGPEGATVAYVGHNAPYLLQGSRLQNRVVIVPTTWDLDARLYRWGGSTAQPYRHGRFRDWADNLRRLGVSYVVVVRTGHENPERAWMAAFPEHFRQVAEQGMEELWRFEP